MSGGWPCDDTIRAYYDYVFPALLGTAIITVLPAFYLYIKAHIQNKLKSTQTLFYCGIVLFTAIIFYYFFLAMQYRSFCHDIEVWFVFWVPPFYLYPLQGLLLVSILFMRLRTIFKDTAFEVSKFTTAWFIALVLILLSFSMTSATFLVITSFGRKNLGLLLSMSFFLGYMFTVLWLNALFVYKLHRVYQSCRDTASRESNMVNTITKTAILCLVSTSQVLFFMVMFLTLGQTTSPHAVLVTRLALIGDLHTNFLSIFLSYSYFAPYYDKLCGCCHMRYKSCWTKCSRRQPQQVMDASQDKLSEHADLSSNVEPQSAQSSTGALTEMA